MNRIRAVLFDLDGTLLDSAPDLVATLNWLRASEGLAALPVDEMSCHVSRGAAGLLNAGMPACDIQQFDQWKSQFLDRYAKYSYQESSLYRGATELLSQLAQCAIPWGIVTNKVESLTVPILRAAGINANVSCVICGDTLRKSKPDPAPVRLACDILKIPARNTLFVGDDIRDIQAGRAAGTMTAAVSYGYGSGELRANGWAQSSYQLNELADLTKQIVSESS
jgi:phosphoglycolate phosphatase